MPVCGAWMKRPRADVEADVADAVEEDEVAGPQAAAGDAPPQSELRVGAVRKCDAEVRVDEAHEARAVEAGARRGAAVDVPDAEEPAREANDTGASVRHNRCPADVSDLVQLRGHCATGADGEARKNDEREQRKANAIGQRRLPSAEAARKEAAALSLASPMSAASRRDSHPLKRWPGIPRAG